MNFKQELVDKILAGEKTVTRRRVNYGYTEGAVRRRRIELPCKYRAGGVYAVQPVIEDGPGKGRGGKGVARIRVLHVKQHPLWSMDGDEDEARLEGFPSSAAFMEYWRGLYGSFDPAQPVWRIEFELVVEEGKG